MNDKQKQVAAQCRAVAHLARALAEVHEHKAQLYDLEKIAHPTLIDFVGRNTASYMETLGNILNGMDAVTQEDEVLAPVFKEAQRLWPQA
jgi:hypothetical protein